MKIVVLVFALVAVAVQAKHISTTPRSILPLMPTLPGAPIYPSPRIVNGNVAELGQFPHQAAVIIDNAAFCGGSLISSEWVLTAGHCVVGGNNWEVTLGQQQRSADEPSRVTLVTGTGILHEKYNALILSNDIAVLKLPSKVKLTDFIKTIALPTRADDDDSLVDKTIVASGWGKDSDEATSVSDQLNYVSLEVITNEECALTFGNLVVNPGKFCVKTDGGHSTCNGDSGGPAVLDNKLVGTTSFGSSAGCEVGSPAGFTKVSHYVDWISNITGIAIKDK